MKSSNAAWFTLMPRILKKPTVRWACRMTGNTEYGPSRDVSFRMLTMSPELQRRNGVALLTKSGVMTIRPGSPSGTGRPVSSSTTSNTAWSVQTWKPS